MASLYTVTTNPQQLLANGLVDFDTNVVKSACNCLIQHVASGDTVEVRQAGVYEVSVNANVTPTDAGEITLQLLNNDSVVSGAQCTSTGVASTTENMAFTSLIRVMRSCQGVIDNNANLQVQVTAPCTISNIAMTITKVD